MSVSMWLDDGLSRVYHPIVTRLPNPMTSTGKQQVKKNVWIDKLHTRKTLALGPIQSFGQALDTPGSEHYFDPEA